MRIRNFILPLFALLAFAAPAFGVETMSEFRKCEIDVSSEIFRMWSFDKDKVPEKYKQMVEAYLNEAVTVASKGTCVPGGPFQCNVGDIRKDCSPCARISGEQRAQTQHQKDAIQEKCGGKQGAPGGAAAVIKDSSSYSGDNSGSAATSRREVRLAANAERQQAIKEATASSSSNNFSSCEEVKQQYDIEELGNAALRGYCACGWITKLSCNPNIVTCQNIPGIANKSKDAAFTTALTEYCKNPTGSSPVKADAQIRAITGTVKDADGKGLAGVSVIVTGTSIGTATDISGNFSLNVTNSNQKRLEFGYPGLKTQTVDISKTNVVDVVMGGNQSGTRASGSSAQSNVPMPQRISAMDAASVEQLEKLLKEQEAALKVARKEEDDARKAVNAEKSALLKAGKVEALDKASTATKEIQSNIDNLKQAIANKKAAEKQVKTDAKEQSKTAADALKEFKNKTGAAEKEYNQEINKILSEVKKQTK